jgi:GNAT superfamily N-acetyltransferase
VIDLGKDCLLKKIDKDSKKKSLNFDCGNVGLNEFFIKECFDFSKELLAVTYYYHLTSFPTEIVCYFTVSNDSINTAELPAGRRKKLKGKVSSDLHMSVFPSVKIGRPGVNEKYKKAGVGSQLLDFIKGFFYYRNKTGCRFITVDSRIDVVSFYEKNGFDILIKDEKKEAEFTHRNLPLESRLMIYDLMRFT